MKFCLLLALAGLSGVAANTAFAATNVTYSATADPNAAPDAITGAGATVDVWTLSYAGTGTSPGNYGSFLGNSANNGGGSGAGAGTSAWGVYAGGGTIGSNEVRITHTFVGGMLALGQSVSINFDAGFVDTSNEYGIRLNGTGGFVLALSFVGSDAGYRYYDGTTSGTLLGFGYSPNGFNFTYRQTGANTYAATVVNGATTLGSWTGTTNGAPNSIQVYNANAGAGGNYDVFSNNLTVVPEPGSVALSVCGLGAVLLGLRRRRDHSFKTIS